MPNLFSHTPEALPPDPSAGIAYPDDYLRGILEETRTIALVGISVKEDRPSHSVMRYLQGMGYRVLPVNPGLAGQVVLGETVYASLADCPAPFQMVDIFRSSEAAGEVVDQALALPATTGIQTLWMQLSVRNDAAAHRAEAAGLKVVMNRCPKIEMQRLSVGPR